MTSKFRTFALGLLLAATAGAAMAHGPYGGYRGGYYRGGGDYFWGPALVGGAIVGTSIYLSRPVQPSTVIITSPPAVVMSNPQPTQWVNSQPVQQPVEAYYCRETGQYFPMVQTCVSPWLVVMR
ncbi:MULTISPECIES: hypothetical protein [unclassified Limnohabitans]|jgi:hypothetical protein|uniref:hypothetical protein n=1 Tax=unclassified Limnohabitans TaxID=2626134 RepID=UPI000CF25A30|nr:MULTISPECIES: hypothetical protein [unclassified Limnohabitans]PQA81327.1 hypothetical protein C5F52_21270 [Limnohabitans sp. TS-CS-82]BDU55384.1 hypothetical protein LTEGF4_10650 [Limnohabitans sp. TEGF004]